MMTYEEWIKSTEFGLRRRYKIEEITYKDGAMFVDFETEFIFMADKEELRYLYLNDGFDELCKEIERHFLFQIKKDI